MKKDGVTVVITTVERPFELRRAINSVLKQNYNPLEIIVVIDGGSLVSKKVVDEYEYLTDITSISNFIAVGGSEARNIGIRASKYDWIALLDDDDEWLDEKLKKQMSKVTGHFSNEVVSFTSLLTYISNPNHKYILPKEKYITGESIGNFLFTLKNGKWNGWVQTSTILASKTVFEALPFLSSLPKHQDWDWIMRVYKSNFSIVHVDEPLSIYHKVLNGKSIAQSPNWKFSQEWILGKKQEISRKSYDNFLMAVVNNGISKDTSLTLIQKIKLINSNDKKISLNNICSIAFIRFKLQYFYNVIKSN